MAGELDGAHFHPRADLPQDRQEQIARRGLANDEKKGIRHATQEENIKAELAERVARAKTFRPGEVVFNHGREGRIVETDSINLKRGNILFQIGRAEAALYNSKKVLRPGEEKV